MNIADNAILTPLQKTLLARFSAGELRSVFYLTGGTALSAFYLFHRLSEDLDFFSEVAVDIEDVLAFIRTLPEIVDARYERKFDRRIFLLRDADGRALKVEFTTYPFPRTEEGFEIEGIAVDSLKDILINKIMALTDRRDPKDYVVIFCALKARTDLDLEQLVEGAESKFGVKGLRYIIRGRFLEGPPPLGELKLQQALESQEMAEFFKSQALSWVARDVENDQGQQTAG